MQCGRATWGMKGLEKHIIKWKKEKDKKEKIRQMDKADRMTQKQRARSFNYYSDGKRQSTSRETCICSAYH